MEADNISSASDKIRMLIDVGREQADEPSGAMLSQLIGILDREGPGQIPAEVAVSPPREADELPFDGNSYYTSFIPARPHADYFDFDTEYNEKTKTDDENKAGDVEGDAKLLVSGTEVAPDGFSAENNAASGSSLSDAAGALDDADQSAQLFIDRLDNLKCEFRHLIQKIDRASLAPRVLSGHMSLDRDSTSVLTDTLVGDIIGTLESLKPQQSRKRPRRTSDVGQLERGAEETLASINSRKIAEEDPCSDIPNFGVVLIKSPTSIAQLWNEYTKIPSEWALPDWFEVVSQQHPLESNNRNPALLMKRRTSIRDLELTYGSSWRNADKNFSRQVNRRKKIWHAIEEGLDSGLPLQECFRILETYAKERGKGLSWYYNGVPFSLKDAMPSKEK